MTWNILQCAVQGRGHLATNIPCQDKTFSVMQDGCTVAALADGAGSARFSHFGAEAVTRNICEFVAKNFDYILDDSDGVRVKKEILATSGSCLQALCKKMDCIVTDLASTLLFVAEKSGSFIICHIGDGVIGYVKDGKVLVASHPENGEFANTTIFTTSGKAIYSMKLIKGPVNKITSFVLMSDGAENSFYSMRDGRLSQTLARIASLVAICDKGVMNDRLHQAFEGIVKQRTSDDCSIVLMATIPKTGYYGLTDAEKCQVLGLCNTRAARRRLISFDQALKKLDSWKSVRMAKRSLHWRGKKIYRILKRLDKAGLLQMREDGWIKSTLATL